LADIQDEKVAIALEAWKTAIGVQEHFNTIEMQIRNLAVTVLTAVLATAGIVFGQAQKVVSEGIGANAPAQSTSVLGLSAADVIIIAGLFAWLAFYFMDRWWYHRLLQGSVAQSTRIETYFAEETPYGDMMGLSGAISKASPFRLFRRWGVHSQNKIDFFYLTVVLVLVLIVIFVV